MDIADEIVGIWNVTYGSPTTVSIFRSPQGYDFVTLGRVKPVGGRCWIPQGTTCCRVQRVGGQTYDGWHGLWWTHNCVFANWARVRLILDPAGRSLVGLVEEANEFVTFTRLAPSVSPLAIAR